jgi:hypothetical protein
MSATLLMALADRGDHGEHELNDDPVLAKHAPLHAERQQDSDQQRRPGERNDDTTGNGSGGHVDRLLECTFVVVRPVKTTIRKLIADAADGGSFRCNKGSDDLTEFSVAALSATEVAKPKRRPKGASR